MVILYNLTASLQTATTIAVFIKEEILWRDKKGVSE